MDAAEKQQLIEKIRTKDDAKFCEYLIAAVDMADEINAAGLGVLLNEAARRLSDMDET